MSFLNFAEANCKNCYKCLRHCPVKAIQIINEQARIIEERCIGCGQCLVVCPQNAREIKSDIKNIRNAISQDKTIIASIAPSFMGAFNVENEGKIVKGLKMIGFQYVEETAVGAEIVANQYKEYIEKNNQENYITTCCPSANYLIEKYYPSLIKQMIPKVSPMIAHGKQIKKRYGKDSYVVFIGPCTSKKMESADLQHQGVIDAVLTFEELDLWFKEENISFSEITPTEFDSAAFRVGSSFPIGGGVLSSFVNEKNLNKYEVISVDGINQCIELFNCLEKGGIKNACIEANVCTGSCIGGMLMPKNDENIHVRKCRVRNYVKNKKDLVTEQDWRIYDDLDFTKHFYEKKINTEVTKEKIDKVLREIGKFTLEDELNCGGCGYNTCREKAKAVVLGMAEIDMCMPFMRSKAEGLKNIIVENSPNALLVIDEDMLIKEINPTAERIFSVNEFNVKNKPLSMLMDDEDFRSVMDTKKSILKKKVIYQDYNNVVLIQNIIYIEKQNVILAIMADVTSEENNKEELSKMKKNTIDAAQEVIEKQMRIAQEIASLLGETTAETKVILTKLKKITMGEKGDL